MKTISNILYVSEPGSECADAFDRAVSLASNNQAHLTVIEVVDHKTIQSFSVNEDWETTQFKIVEERKSQLEQLVAPCREKISIRTEVFVGIGFIEAIKKVLRDKHDIVIKTAVEGKFFGGDDMHLLRKCPCPVWLVKPHQHPVFERVLALVDVDDTYPTEELAKRFDLNDRVLQLSLSLAIADSSALHIATVWEAIGEGYMRGRARMPEKEVAEYVQGQAQKYENNLQKLMKNVESDYTEYVKPELHLIKGFPTKEIPFFADSNKIDLVVMGTVARTGIPGLIIGNTAEAILNRINCSVLAIKPDGFESPVKLCG